ncbi:MAG TPA: carboxypeptidase-like regulatory domain-containing protein, partial [Bacteroidales bacterium]
MKKIPIGFLFQKKLLLRMKLTTLILCFGILQVSASTLSIGQNLSLHLKDKTIRESLKTIENQSNFRFFFNDAFSDLNKVISIDADNKSIREILGEILSSSKVTYKVLENNLVVIAPVTELQQQTITGTVTDANTGEVLAAVSILIEGTTQGTLTDQNGKYTITVPNSSAVLVFSYIGYNSERRVVGNTTTIDMALVPDIKDLDAVVVVG